MKAAPGDPTNTAADAIDSLVDAMLDEWQANSDPVHAAIQQALDSSTSFEDFQVAVEQRLAAMDATALADLLSRGTGGPPLGQSDQRRTHLTWPPSSWSRCRREAVEFFRQKGYRMAFAWQDMPAQEHAAAFTVAKAMRLDVLKEIRGATDRAIAEGTTFQDFRRTLGPQLRDKGWWGKREMVDPVTGRDGQCAARQRCQVAQDL